MCSFFVYTHPHRTGVPSRYANFYFISFNSEEGTTVVFSFIGTDGFAVEMLFCLF